MSRAKGGPKTRHRRKGRLKLAKGYYGAKSKLFRTATEAVDKSLVYAYRDRRNKKRVARRDWHVQINAAVRPYGFSYSRFMDALKKKSVALDRKMLTELAQSEPDAFKALLDRIRA